MPLEMFDITTLIGNILQNAVEAAIKADVPRIRVEFIEQRYTAMKLHFVMD